jgi:hypothetical protein
MFVPSQQLVVVGLIPCSEGKQKLEIAVVVTSQTSKRNFLHKPKHDSDLCICR